MKTYLDLDFIGKDSVPCKKTVEIDPVFANNFKSLILNKDQDSKIFDSVSYIDINEYFHSLSPGCTPKVLRTCKLNQILVEELKKKTITPEDSLIKKLRALTEANIAVSTQANHQKNVGKNYKEQANKSKEKLNANKEHLKELRSKAKDKLIKIQEELEAAKALWTGQKLKEKVAALKEKREKIKSQIEKAELAVDKAEFDLDKKKATSNINTGTALASYSDPQVIVSWCRTFNVPIEKVYSKAQIKNIDWALDCDINYWRKLY